MCALSQPLDALRRSGELALLALAAMPETGTVVFDPDLAFVLGTGEAADVFGFPAGEAEGRALSQVLVPQTTVLEPLFRGALEGRHVSSECTSADGERTHEVTVAPVQAGGVVLGGICVARDVTRRRLAEAGRRLSEEQSRTAFDNSLIGMALVGTDGRWFRVNQALCVITGCFPDELLQKRYQDLTHPDDLAEDMEHRAKVLAGVVHGYQMRKRYLRADGTVVWVLLSNSLVRDEAGEPLHFIEQVQDISQRKRLEDDVRRLQSRDSLTNLCNRRHFEDALARQLGLCQRNGEIAALLLVDIDDFHLVNDTLGRSCGDRLLQHVARELTARLGQTGAIARLGDDEFSVILPEASSPVAARLAATLRAALSAAPIDVGGGSITLEVTTGVASLDGCWDTEEVLCTAANAPGGAIKPSRDR
jgi:diguanylate cyclase (GGDEF)-like protein/PAS domain S-box-containing protein